jgi:lipopolysaccharide/colanic/teichoic acid biosynthesis glycosyltransferase
MSTVPGEPAVASSPEPISAHLPRDLISNMVRRGIDILIAGLALLVLSPVLLIIAVAIWLTSPGPALFGQVRVGRHGSGFRMFKFRSMYHGSDDTPHREYVTSLLTSEHASHGGEEGVYKLTNDRRITAVGSWLRRTSLDELPQLLNVVRGDMSLVGPRPMLPWEAELLRPQDAVRFSVKPGITGLWQVRGRNSLTMREGLELDAEYVSRRSLHLDIAILLGTIPAVVAAALTGRGVR